MREYITLPWEKVIPAGLLTPKVCALVEPMSVGFHAVSRAQVTDIDVVLVIGCGMVGMGAVVRSVMRGATVVAADIDDGKLVQARKMGASYTINTRTENVHQRLMEMTSGFGPDVVIEAVGSTPTYQMAVDEVAFTGRVVCIGYAKTEVSFQTKFFVQKELDIRGSRNAQPSDFRAVIHYLERVGNTSGESPVDALITKVIKPEEALDTMRWWSENPGKVFRILVEF
jgi:threonine dehydrogenase-like Zn-dependent dehydrogenase